MQKIRIAINGFGRIGRNILRALYESDAHQYCELIAVNDRGKNLETHLLLIKHDSTHGKFAAKVAISQQATGICITHNNTTDFVTFCAISDPTQLPWKQLNIDIVLECTGAFTSGESAAAHLQAGAKRVLISAPATNVDGTIVYGVNHHSITATGKIFSNASCTTNCLAPLVDILHRKLGIISGFMTTIHACTNDQSLIDSYHTDARRGRAAFSSMIPTKTGAAQAVALVLPALAGKLDGLAVRVPTTNVSLVDFTFIASHNTTAEEVNNYIYDAVSADFANIISYNVEQLVSIDFNHSTYSSIFDSTQTKVTADLVKILAWYDNEWGFCNRMLDTAQHIMRITR